MHPVPSRDLTVFVSNAHAVAAFIHEHDRPPVVSATGRERTLANWLAGVRHDHRRERLSSARVAVLNDVLPGWDAPRFGWPQSTSPQARADALRTFRTTHGRWPSPTSDDPSERALANWRNRARNTPHLAAVLDSRVPGWRGRPTIPGNQQEHVFARRAQATAQFRTRYGRWPSSSSHDLWERQLGTWWAQARSRTDPDSARGQLLDRLCDGWRQPNLDRVNAFGDHVTRVALFVRERNRLPDAHASDAQEVYLAGWLAAQRKPSTVLSPEQEGLLDQHAPGWQAGGHADVVARRVEQVAAFLTGRGVFPVSTSSDAHEVALAGWLAKQRSRAKHGRALPVDAELDRVAPGWRERPARPGSAR